LQNLLHPDFASFVINSTLQLYVKLSYLFEHGYKSNISKNAAQIKWRLCQFSLVGIHKPNIAASVFWGRKLFEQVLKFSPVLHCWVCSRYFCEKHRMERVFYSRL